jgi:hypothetical protein
MEVNPQKVEPPTTVLEFLGIIIDSDRMELRMSEDRLNDIITELKRWDSKKSGTKRELLSLLGKLVFLSRVIQPGRTFLRRLFELSTKVELLHQKVKLNADARDDISWWLQFAYSWNRVSVFYEDLWITSVDLTLATDASDAGYGAVFGTHWFMTPFTTRQAARPIALRELLAIVVACEVWGNEWGGKRILIQCDNATVVCAVNSGSSRNKDMMSLIRHLFFVAAERTFDVRLVHIPGLDNIGPDRLSRLDTAGFFAEYPHADSEPTAVHAECLQSVSRW